MRREDGVALVAALLATMLLTALAGMLVLATMTETRTAASYRDALQTLYAADAAVELAINDVRGRRDWDTLEATGVRWQFAAPAEMAVVEAASSAVVGGKETLELVARANGPGGAVRVIHIALARDQPGIPGEIHVISWRDDP
jgi:Tfp pilus assembly protein PilX